ADRPGVARTCEHQHDTALHPRDGGADPRGVRASAPAGLGEDDVPRYADRLLADGERVALRARQHWLAPLVRGKTALAILIAALVLLALNSNLNQGNIRDIFGWFAFGLLALSLLWLTQVFMALSSGAY